MDISKIRASLKYGKYFGTKAVVILYLLLAFSLIMILLMLTMGLLTIFVEELTWDSETAIVVIGGSLLGLLLGGLSLWLIHKCHLHKKDILQWLDDSINANAFVKRLDSVSLEYKPYQVQVDFEINGEKHYKISAPGSFLGGYHKVFARYDNKTINILYSPQYDEVLILKDKAN